MKYDYAQLVELITTPVNVTIHRTSGLDDDAQVLQAHLNAGYEIYKAISFSTSTIAGIKYILRKELPSEK